MKDNQLGQKIKQLRKQKKMTQAELVGTKITRNMLSSIENGTAFPSLETLDFIAERLDTTVAHLLSDDSYDLTFQKKEKIDSIYRAYIGKNYTACIRIILSLPELDDELSYLLASAYLELANKNVADGSMISAAKNLEEAIKYAGKTRIGTETLLCKANMLLAIAKNVQSPLLEFDEKEYQRNINIAGDYEFYKYIVQDPNFKFTSTVFTLHSEAKKLIKERSYAEACEKLLEAADKVKEDGYNAYIVFCIYTDLEYCYKQLYDFEKAYLYSTKRMTMIEGFKS